MKSVKVFNLKFSQYILFFLLLIAAGCSSSQSTMYKPSDGEAGWNIDVTKKDGLTDEFICKINGTTVISASFPFIGDNFEKSGTYKGKKVKMNGYKSSTTITGADGKVQSTDKFQIRVFIDDQLVDKFDF
ncbi:MAG TPA: hypothetical protein PK536_14075 [Ignavibacteria bacterium]|nr:hypothetical protein [Ignavibacteria bacterium]HRK00486.1 hypothetical protein [Ignavibacteria bacterium]